MFGLLTVTVVGLFGAALAAVNPSAAYYSPSSAALFTQNVHSSFSASSMQLGNFEQSDGWSIGLWFKSLTPSIVPASNEETVLFSFGTGALDFNVIVERFQVRVNYLGQSLTLVGDSSIHQHLTLVYTVGSLKAYLRSGPSSSDQSFTSAQASWIVNVLGKDLQVGVVKSAGSQLTISEGALFLTALSESDVGILQGGLLRYLSATPTALIYAAGDNSIRGFTAVHDFTTPAIFGTSSDLPSALTPRSATLCQDLLRFLPNLPTGTYTQRNGESSFCDQSIQGGGWQLLVRSSPTPSSIGWFYSSGGSTVNDFTTSYSFGLPQSQDSFEILAGSNRQYDNLLNNTAAGDNIYQFTVSNLPEYYSTASQTTNRSVVNSPTATPCNDFPPTFLYYGYTDYSFIFFRDMAALGGNGLLANHWDTYFYNCLGSNINREQGLLFFRQV